MSMAPLNEAGLPTYVQDAIRYVGVRADAPVLTDVDSDERPMSVIAISEACLVHVDEIDEGDDDSSRRLSVDYIPWTRIREVSVYGERLHVRTDMDRPISADAADEQQALLFASMIAAQFPGAPR